MAPAAPKSCTIILKLLVDPKRPKVLFAEAGKDFVDFLFTLLSLPVGTVTRLLSKDGMVGLGTFGKLYEGVENLSDTYMQPYLDKDILLNPKTPVAGPNVLGLLESPATNKVFYMCSQNCNSPSPSPFGGIGAPAFPADPASHRYVTEDPKELCPSCKSTMSSEATYVGQPKATTEATSGTGAAGYVKDFVTYMIMDDLEVKPLMSTISSITLLNRFGVKDISALEVKVVELGMNEGVKLLRESLNSSSVLTNVFLGKKAAAVAVSSVW